MKDSIYPDKSIDDDYDECDEDSEYDSYISDRSLVIDDYEIDSRNSDCSEEDIKDKKKNKKPYFMKYFSSYNEYDYHYQNFDDYKEAILKNKDLVESIQNKILKIYSKYDELYWDDEINVDEEIDINYFEFNETMIKKELKLDKRTPEEISKLVYIFSLVIFNIISNFVESFISAKKPYDNIREKFINEVVRFKIEIKCNSIRNIHSIIKNTKNNTYNSNKINNEEENSIYYNTLYSNGKNSQLLTILKSKNYSKKENKQKEAEDTSKTTSASNSTYNIINTSSNNKDQNYFRKKIKTVEENFIRNLDYNTLGEILNDTWTAFIFMNRFIDTSCRLFDEMLQIYSKHSPLVISEFSKVFLEYFYLVIRQDPFINVLFFLSAFFQRYIDQNLKK